MAEDPGSTHAFSLQRLWSSFNYREYRRYWTGSSLTIVTIRIQEVVLGWQILELTGSAFWLGLVAFAYGLPLLILSPLTGFLADRYRRQQVVMSAAVLAAAASGWLAFHTLAGTATPNKILLTSLAIGCSFSLFAPARLALLPSLVPSQQLYNAATMEYASTRLMGFFGPMAAGALLGSFGIGPALLVQTGLFITAGFVFLATGPNVGRPAAVRHSGVFQGLHEAFAYLLKTPALLGLFSLGLLVVPFGMTYTRLTQVFVRDVLQAGPTTLGVALALSGLGAAISGLLITMLKAIRYRGRVVLASSAIFGAGLIALSYSSRLPVTLPLLFALGLISGVFLTISQVTLQTDAPDALRGRLLSIWGMVWGLLPFTNLLAGAVADVWGVTAVFLVTGIFCLLACGLQLATRGKLLQLK